MTHSGHEITKVYSRRPKENPAKQLHAISKVYSRRKKVTAANQTKQENNVTNRLRGHLSQCSQRTSYTNLIISHSRHTALSSLLASIERRVGYRRTRSKCSDFSVLNSTVQAWHAQKFRPRYRSGRSQRRDLSILIAQFQAFGERLLKTSHEIEIMIKNKRAVNTDRRKRARSMLTSEQKAAMRAIDAARRREKRAKQTIEEKTVERAINALRQRIRRAKQADQQKEFQRELNALCRRVARDRQISDWNPNSLSNAQSFRNEILEKSDVS